MISYSNDSGESEEHAIKIWGAENEQDGIRSEYEYLSKQFGEQGTDWNLAIQSLLFDKETGKVYDMMDLYLQHGKGKTLFFDITDFYGRS